MPSDLHRGFPDPARVDGHDVAEFLLAADRLPGLRRVRRAMRARTVVATGGILVDLGCGPGWETARLAAGSTGARVVGVDHNPVLIAAARARVPGGHPEWVCADLTEPGLAPGSVEVVRTERVLMYVPDLAAAVGQIVGLLHPGGRVVAFELDYGATVLAPGHAPVSLVRAATARMERSLPQPWAGRLLPGLLHDHGLSVTTEPHSFDVNAVVWRRIVRDTLASAPDDGQVDRDGLTEWLTELDDPVFPGFRAAFTGILTTAERR